MSSMSKNPLDSIREAMRQRPYQARGEDEKGGTSDEHAPEPREETWSRFDFDKALMHEDHFTVGDKYRIYHGDGISIPLLYAERERFGLHTDIHVYDNEWKSRELLTIRDRSVFDINANMEVMDPATGELLGSFKRKAFLSIVLMRTWEILDKQGVKVGVAQEAPIWKALLCRVLSRLHRRFLLKTDFVIKLNGRLVGKFIRQWTIEDKYVLDLTADSPREFDRRLAVCLGILLDTAEGR